MRASRFLRFDILRSRCRREHKLDSQPPAPALKIAVGDDFSLDLIRAFGESNSARGYHLDTGSGLIFALAGFLEVDLWQLRYESVCCSAADCTRPSSFLRSNSARRSAFHSSTARSHSGHGMRARPP